MMQLFVILLITFAIIYFTIIIAYSFGWHYTPFFQAEKNVMGNTKISVIIAARNEAANIAACLNALKKQTYSNALFEVIVIDDHSEDNTYEVAEKIIVITDNWKIRKLENLLSNAINSSFKKQAITKGIEIATGDLIVTLDADCIANENWLSTIAQFYEANHSKMIVMPVRFQEGNTPLQIFQQMDLSGLIGITAGSIMWNFPVMANGANLAFEKKVFEAVNGYKGNEHLPGGDDIMLLLKIEKQYPESIQFLKCSDVAVTTKTVNNLNEFYNQRIRWISKSGKFGDWKITAVLALSYCFNAFVIAGFFIGNWKLMLLSITIMMLKWLVEFYLVCSASKFLQHSFSVFHYVWCNIAHQLYVVVFGLLGTTVKFEWKGRKY